MEKRTLNFNPFELERVEDEQKAYIEKAAEYLDKKVEGAKRYTLEELAKLPDDILNSFERHV